MRYADKKAIYGNAPAGQSSKTPPEQAKTPVTSRPAPKVQIGNSPSIPSDRSSTN